MLSLEVMQGTVTAATVGESKYSRLPEEGNSPTSSSQLAGLGKVHSKGQGNFVTHSI